MSNQKKDWFRLKRYPHIGFPLKNNERYSQIEPYIKNPEKIAKHSFLPFIHNTVKVRKFRKKYSTKNGKAIKTTIDGKEDIYRHSSFKSRDLYYAGHWESLIYSYYSQLISEKYEELIKAELNDVVTAYREIKIDTKKEGNKCNIDFAVDVFKFISKYPSDHFVVIAFDISQFFDRLNHEQLRNKWKYLFGFTQEMPEDHFNVFKSITRYQYIDLLDIFKMFQDQIFYLGSEQGRPIIKRKEISKIKFLKKENSLAFCTKEEYLKVKNKLIRRNPSYEENGEKRVRNFGIPQGSPISSVLANIYMLDFDLKINRFLRSIKGLYKRYSDDMIVVCNLEEKENVINLFTSEIQSLQLEIKSEKTQIFHFHREDGRLFCGQEFENSINYNKKLTYLGLEYDGEFVLVKSGSISNYYRKMKRSIRRGKFFAKRPENKFPGTLFKSRILKQFSYKGAARRRKFLWNKKKKHFEVSTHYDWGNYLSYTNKAKNMKFKNKISNQMKKHWKNLNEAIRS